MPLLAAAAVAPGPVTLTNVPLVSDLCLLVEILKRLGIDITLASVARIGSAPPTSDAIPAALSSRLRGSVYALAVPAVWRGTAVCGPIGGDSLRAPSRRRADLLPHIRAFAGVGMELTRASHGWRVAGGPPRPGEFAIDDDGVSASALAAILAASAEGRSIVRGASLEIEVEDTLAALAALGAGVAREGRTLIIEGPLSARPAVIAVPPDRIHAGTLAIAASISGGCVTLPSDLRNRMTTTLDFLASAGVAVSERPELTVGGRPSRPAQLVSDMYPGFPTDLLPPAMVLLACAPGRSVATEQVYDARFDHVPALAALGARIRVEDKNAMIEGPTQWRAGRVEGSGIRETAAVVLATLLASGESVVENADALARGYEDLPQDLRDLGASIRWEREPAAFDAASAIAREGRMA